MELIIDNRERDLIKWLEDYNDKINEGKIQFSKENLDLGDIIFKKNGEIIILIERKTLGDLSSSIKDGRYKEQKIRILNSISPSVRKIYLIEGKDMKCFKLPHNTFNSIIIHTIIRDNIHVKRTDNLNGSGNFIIDINNRINKIKFNEKIEDYSQICRPNKKSNITGKVCCLNMLQQIPGVSSKLAGELYNNYGNLQMIYSKFINGEDFIKNIKDMKYGGEKKRRVGEKTATKIAKFLYISDINIGNN